MTAQDSSSDPATDHFGRPALGGNWAVHNGDVGIVTERDLGILSDNAPMLGLGIMAWCAETFAADQFSEAILSADVDPKVVLQVFVRRCDDGGRYAFHWNPAGHWEMKHDGLHPGSVLATVSSPPPGPEDRLRVEVAGTTITGFHNGAEVLSAAVPALAGAEGKPGQPGVVFRVVGVEHFPTPVVSSWTGGSLRPHPEGAG